MFDKPFSFKGRIRRKEMGVTSILYLLGYLMVLRPLGVHIQQNTHTDTHDTMIIIEFLLFIAFFIMLMWFHLAQGAKRCHDIDKSGWWQLIPFWNLILYFQDGVKGSNKYGENPKGRKL